MSCHSNTHLRSCFHTTQSYSQRQPTFPARTDATAPRDSHRTSQSPPQSSSPASSSSSSGRARPPVAASGTRSVYSYSYTAATRSACAVKCTTRLSTCFTLCVLLLVSSRYKSELRMVPEDSRLASDHNRQQQHQHESRTAATGSSSITSSSSRYQSSHNPSTAPVPTQSNHHPVVAVTSSSHRPIRPPTQTSLASKSQEHQPQQQHYTDSRQAPPPQQQQQGGGVGGSSSRCITLRYGEQRTASLDSISRCSSDDTNTNSSSANSGSHDLYSSQSQPPSAHAYSRLHAQPHAQSMPPNSSSTSSSHLVNTSTAATAPRLPLHYPGSEYPLAAKRSLDNLDSCGDESRTRDMGNTHRRRSRSGERTDPSGAAAVGDAHMTRRSRGNRATEELRRKFFENGLMPQSGGGPVYGAHSLSTSALHKAQQQQLQQQQQTMSATAPRHTMVTSRPMTSSHPDMTSTQQQQPHRRASPRQTSRHAVSTLHQSIDFNHRALAQGEPGAPATDNYGLTVSLSSVLGGAGGSGDDQEATMTSSVGGGEYHRAQQRLSLQDQHTGVTGVGSGAVNARKRIFESDGNLSKTQSPQHAGGHAGGQRGSPLSPSPYHRYGQQQAANSNSNTASVVSSKAAFYEQNDHKQQLQHHGETVTSSLSSQSYQLVNERLVNSPPQVPPTGKLPLYFRSQEMSSAATPTSRRHGGQHTSPSPDRFSHQQQQQSRRSRSQSSERERGAASSGKYRMMKSRDIVSSMTL